MKQDTCNFCGKHKEETILLIAGENGQICDQCIEQAFEMREKELSLPITKTARVIAKDREITLNAFEGIYIIHIHRNQIATSQLPDSFDQKVRLTKQTLCLLVKFLNESVKNFDIDYEAVIKELTNDQEPKLIFTDLTKD